MSEENEPRNIEQNGAEEKESIGAAKALTATLNGNQSEQRDCNIYERYTIVQCSKRSNQRASNLAFSEFNRE